MSFPAFAQEDFDVFTIEGLEPRMSALIERVRPKLTAIGEQLSPWLSLLSGEEMYPHVAKHARRTVHPPNDTWVAWAPAKRGYKALPHFQFGLWGTHAFAQFAIIYESNNKEVFAEKLERNLSVVMKKTPGIFQWSMDHMNPEGTPHASMDKADFERIAKRLREVKSSEVTCGLMIDRHDPILADPGKLRETIEQTFTELIPLYRLSK